MSLFFPPTFLNSLLSNSLPIDWMRKYSCSNIHLCHKVFFMYKTEGKLSLVVLDLTAKCIFLVNPHFDFACEIPLTSFNFLHETLQNVNKAQRTCRSTLMILLLSKKRLISFLMLSQKDKIVLLMFCVSYTFWLFLYYQCTMIGEISNTYEITLHFGYC